jgi:hypothetical protein
MPTDAIIQTITNIFSGADERDWEKIRHALADEVLLDYSSMNGIPASTTTAEDIIKAWKGFLPGFGRTHHQLSSFQGEQQGNSANVRFLGKADHFIGNDSWTVEGIYNVEAIKVGKDWKVTKFKFNLQKQSGNTALPQKAMEKAASK